MIALVKVDLVEQPQQRGERQEPGGWRPQSVSTIMPTGWILASDFDDLLQKTRAQAPAGVFHQVAYLEQIIRRRSQYKIRVCENYWILLEVDA